MVLSKVIRLLKDLRGARRDMMFAGEEDFVDCAIVLQEDYEIGEGDIERLEDLERAIWRVEGN